MAAFGTSSTLFGLPDEGWIVNRQYDLLWFFSASLLGYLFIYVHLGLGVSGMFLWWFWVMSVDSPHFFGTYLRTYCDKIEMQERGRWLKLSLILLVFGPMSILLGMLMGSRIPFMMFINLSFLYGWWHIFRQHWGFVTLYQRKNGESPGWANLPDYVFFHVLMLVPFLYFMLNSASLPMRGYLPPGGVLSAIMAIVIFGTLTAYYLREVVRYHQGHALNKQKHLYFLTTIPFYLLIYMHPYFLRNVEFMAIPPIITVFHNIQYHGLINFYSENRYRKQSSRNYGLAGLIGRKFWIYYAACLGFAWTYRTIQFGLEGVDHPFAVGPNWLASLRVGEHFYVTDFAIALAFGVAIHHYYLDQNIWKVSKSKKLSKNLKMP